MTRVRMSWLWPTARQTRSPCMRSQNRERADMRKNVLVLLPVEARHKKARSGERADRHRADRYKRQWCRCCAAEDLKLGWKDFFKLQRFISSKTLDGNNLSIKVYPTSDCNLIICGIALFKEVLFRPSFYCISEEAYHCHSNSTASIFRSNPVSAWR